jgi:hypothetical protein
MSLSETYRLTATQTAALVALRAENGRYRTAAEMGVSAPALAALVRKGLAQTHHSISADYGWTAKSYKMTGTGLVVARTL